MPRLGEAQLENHPWRKRADAQVKQATAKKKDGARPRREPFVCVSCGDPECIAGECASDF